MKKNFGPKAWLYPMPALIIGSYDENGIADAMNAAWGGLSILCRLRHLRKILLDVVSERSWCRYERLSG